MLSCNPRSCRIAEPVQLNDTHARPPYPHPRQPLPHNFAPSCLAIGSMNSVRFVLTPRGTFYCGVPVWVHVRERVSSVRCRSRESLKSRRGKEGCQKQINTWTPRDKISPCCWSYFTRRREGAEKFRGNKSIALRQGCKDQKNMRRRHMYIYSSKSPHMCHLHESSAFVPGQRIHYQTNNNTFLLV